MIRGLAGALLGIPVIGSEYIPYGTVIQSDDPRIIVFSALRLWVWRLRSATLPASTEGTEFVADILGGVA